MRELRDTVHMLVAGARGRRPIDVESLPETLRVAPVPGAALQVSVGMTLESVERRLIEGLPTAVTDAAGRFTIGAEHLPIGAAYDFYTLLNNYGGTYTVLAEVYLDVIKSPLSGATQVVLNQNRLTTVTVTVQ